MFEVNQFYTPDFVLAELNEYREVFLKNQLLVKQMLKAFIVFLFSRITVVPNCIISEGAYRAAEAFVADIDPKDIGYVALNDELNATLLTRDKELCQGLKVKAYARIRLFSNTIADQNNEKESQ